MKLILKQKIASFINKNKHYKPKKNNHSERLKQKLINKKCKKLNVSKLL